MADPVGLTAALALYRNARRDLLAAVRRPASNRDPMAEWAEALVEVVLGAPRVTSRVQAGHDLVDALGRRIEVKTLANTPGAPWVNGHPITAHPGRDLYAIVLFEDFAPLGLLVVDMGKLAILGALLHKRNPDQHLRFELLESNARSILADPAAFAAAGVSVYRPPLWAREP